MKTPILFLFLFAAAFAHAQFCGQSGPAVCSPVAMSNDTSTVIDFSPYDSLPCIERNVAYNESFMVKVDTSVAFIFGGQAVSVYSFRIDSITNLPCNICWATNKTNNTISSGDSMCVNLKGTTQDVTGQYKLKFIITVNIGVDITTNSDAAGLKYHLRVINQGGTCQPVDTNATNQTAHICPTGLNDETTEVPSVKLLGNLLQIEAADFTQKMFLTDLTGKLLKEETIFPSTTSTINVSDVRGIFFVTLESTHGYTTVRFFK